MFRWYRDARKCYVYLSDVSAGANTNNRTEQLWESTFRKSKWFTRGWTLQELLAPKSVEFFSREGEWLGDKNTLQQQIHEITGIPIEALRGTVPLSDFSIGERMQWASKRDTKKKEDKAYCLQGIFGVFIPLIYGEKENASKRLLREIDESSRSKAAKEMDTWIRKECYRPANLKIERLSGEELSMDQCYINLAIVQQHPQDAHSSGDEDTSSGESNTAHRSSPFSLLTRLHVKERNEGTHVLLSKIFDSRKGGDDYEKQPRRILIRGQAGVGKTTLCKKMVHDFTYAGMWTNLFSRLLWIPLRKLKGRSMGYKVQNLFSDVFFLTHEYPASAALELHKAIDDSKSTQTLFVLDGLDEISQDFEKDGDIFQLLLYLLNRPNVIITSRPYGVLPSGLDPLDLELETIGFYPEQVNAYLEKTFADPYKVEEIQSFLQNHWLIQSLVRIPIQLDAVCLTWDPADNFGRVPESMTMVYQSIERNLWKKDLVRLEKVVQGKPLNDAIIQRSRPPIIEGFVKNEIILLETLAFIGIYHDVIHFEPYFLDTIYAYLASQELVSLPDQVLANVSFLRTPDPSPENRNQSFHFLHLTFQEYFAARYFVRHWKAGRDLECLQFEVGSIEKISPIVFLQKHKHLIRYNILWRFVAGLLQSQGADMVQFFEALEEPPDLLGPAHQRLIMHCLSEVTRSNSQRNFSLIREKLEKTLSDWLHFECNFRERVELAHEIEFPERVASSILLNGPEEVRVLVLESLSRHPRTQLGIIIAAASLLEENQPVRSKIATCGVLKGYHRQLPKEILKKLVARLEDQDRNVRQATLGVLQGQSSLSDEILERVMARLEHQDQDVREAALKVLQGQSSLPDEILLKPQCIESLYTSWLQRSFSEQVNGYLVDCGFSLHTPEGVKNFSFTSEDALIRFGGIIEEVQSSLHIPKKWNMDGTALLMSRTALSGPSNGGGLALREQARNH